MQTKVEGIVLKKIPHRDQDLIVTLLLRSGHKISALFYGGRSCRKESGASIIEIGFLLQINLTRPRHRSNSDSELYVAREWSLLWHHNSIRLSRPAYYLMAFYCDLLQGLSSHIDLHQEFVAPDQVSLFRILSNGLYHLEGELKVKKEKKEQWELKAHLGFFLSKLLFGLGVAPILDHCVFCDRPLDGTSPPYELSFTQGGFACASCSSTPYKRIEELWGLMQSAKRFRYEEIGSISGPSNETLRPLWDYFCIQNHLNSTRFKTFEMAITLAP